MQQAFQAFIVVDVTNVTLFRRPPILAAQVLQRAHMHAHTKLLHGISIAGGGQAVATGRGYGLKGDGGRSFSFPRVIGSARSLP